MPWVAYIVQCSDGSFYCGVTNRLKHRVRAHNGGTGAKYTRSRRPVHLVWHQPCESKSAALAMEWHIKHLTRPQKQQFINIPLCKVHEMNEITTIRNAIDQADSAYYNLGRSPLSDSQYDAMKARLKILAPDDERHTRRRAPVPLTSDHPKMKHTLDVLSLDKAYTVEDMIKWNEACTGGPYTSSLKGDGLTIVGYYEAGKLAMVVTAGGNDGVGEVITPNAVMFRGVPQHLPVQYNCIIRWEAILNKADFEALNAELDEDDQYKTPRNAAAGIVGRLDGQDSDCICAYAIDLISPDPDIRSQEDKYKALEAMDCIVIPWWTCQTLKDTITKYQDVLAERDKLPFEIDGYVVYVDPCGKQRQLGCTDHHPRYAIAWKFPAEEATTTLKDVVWAVGHTGKITPAGVLEPVQIGGTTVSSVVLDNIQEIRSLGLNIGDTVAIIRAGDVIPDVSRVVALAANPIAINEPAHCPSCGGPTGRQKNTDGSPTIHLYCLSPDTCPGVQRKRIANWIKKTGIKEIGDAVLDALMTKDEAGGALVSTIPDLYRLRDVSEYLAEMSIKGKKFGAKRTATILAEIDKTRQMTIDTFLGSLGVKHLGRRKVALIRVAEAKQFDGRMDHTANIAWWFTDPENGKSSLRMHGDSLGVRNISSAIQADIDAKRPLIEELLQTITITQPAAPAARVSTDHPMSGRSVCFTGVRADAALAVRMAALGIVEKSGVSKGLDFLVAKDPSSNSGKAQKARDLGTKVMGLQEFKEAVA